MIGLKKWLLSCKIPAEQVTELDWNQEALVHFPTASGFTLASVTNPSSGDSEIKEDMSAGEPASNRPRPGVRRVDSMESEMSYASESSSDSQGWIGGNSNGAKRDGPSSSRQGSQDNLLQPSQESLGYPPLSRRTSGPSFSSNRESSSKWSDKGVTIKVVCTPAQHRSGRGLLDQMSTLWCSWVVGVLGDLEGHKERRNDAVGRASTEWRWRSGFNERDGFRAFFAGDTGYRYAGAPEAETTRAICPAFQGESLRRALEHCLNVDRQSKDTIANTPMPLVDTATRYGPVDISFLPISTGSSLSFLRKLFGVSLHHYSLTSAQHCNAWDAIQIAKMMGSRAAMAIHHSTFSPEDESRGCVFEFYKTREEEDVSGEWGEEGCFVVSNVGEVLEMEARPESMAAS